MSVIYYIFSNIIRTFKICQYSKAHYTSALKTAEHKFRLSSTLHIELSNMFTCTDTTKLFKEFNFLSIDRKRSYVTFANLVYTFSNALLLLPEKKFKHGS